MFNSNVLKELAIKHKRPLEKLTRIEDHLNDRFTGMDKPIRALILSVASGEPLLLTGTLTDASSAPHLLDEPTRLELKGSEALDLNVEIELDRRGEVAIEVKGSSRVDYRKLNGLRAFASEHAPRRAIVVCNEHWPRERNGIHLLPYREFFRRLWAGEITA